MAAQVQDTTKTRLQRLVGPISDLPRVFVSIPFELDGGPLGVLSTDVDGTVIWTGPSQRLALWFRERGGRALSTTAVELRGSEVVLVLSADTQGYVTFWGHPSLEHGAVQRVPWTADLYRNLRRFEVPPSKPSPPPAPVHATAPQTHRTPEPVDLGAAVTSPLRALLILPGHVLDCGWALLHHHRWLRFPTTR